MIMVLALIGCDPQGGTPEWTEVTSVDGLEGTWSYMNISYSITKNDVTAKVDGQIQNGYPISCEEFEAGLGKGQLSLFVNSNKTKIKFVVTVEGTKIEQIYTKQ